MDVFPDVDGGRLITTDADVGIGSGINEALMIDLAALIGQRAYEEWIADFDQLGRLGGLNRQPRILSVNESKGVVHGLMRMAFPDHFHEPLDDDLEWVSPAAAPLLEDLGNLALRPHDVRPS